MFKKILPTAVLASVFLTSVTGHALTPGFYMDMGGGWGWTELNKTFKDVKVTYALKEHEAKVSLISISDNGLSGHLGVGYQINKYFGLEVGYGLIWTGGAEGKAEAELKDGTKITFDQTINFSGTHIIDLTAKGVFPLEKVTPSLDGFNLFIKGGGAFLFHPGHKFQLKTYDGSLMTGSLIKNTIAPEVGFGLSYDIGSNLSMYASVTHINTDILGERTKKIDVEEKEGKFTMKNQITPGNINSITLGLIYTFL